MTSLQLHVETIPLPASLRHYFGIRCPACEAHLRVHQPDERSPDRLLGTCPACSAWYLIDAGAEVMCRLPDERALRDA